MHCNIMELANQLWRQVWIIRDLALNLLVCRRSNLNSKTKIPQNIKKKKNPSKFGKIVSLSSNKFHLLAVSLWEVDNSSADGR